MFFIGIDLSDRFFDSCISNSSGDVLSNSRFDFNDDGFASFVRKIGEYESDSKNCIVGIENPHSPSINFSSANWIRLLYTYSRIDPILH